VNYLVLLNGIKEEKEVARHDFMIRIKVSLFIMTLPYC